MPEPKKISFLAAILMNINIIVGSGIYIYPQFMTKQAGGISFLSWIFAGLLLLPIVLTIAQAARIFPGEGGFYNYSKTALGENMGFIANWAYLLGYMGTVATITSVIRDRLIDPIGLTWVQNYPIIFYIVFLLLISLLNIINIQLISRIQSAITLLKLLPLVLMLGVIYFYWNPNFDYQITKIGDLSGTLPMALFSFLGFESCCNISHYIRGGSTRAFNVILIAFSTSVILYTVFHLGMLHIMGPDALASQGVQAFPQFMGFAAQAASIIALILLVDMMLSFTNTTYGAALNNITNINVLAKSKLVFQSPFLSKLNTNGMPANAAFIHALFIIVLIILIPSTKTLTAITNLGVCIAFLLTLVAVFVQSWRKKIYGVLVMAAISFFSMGILLFLTWTQNLGNNNWERLIYSTPILIGIPIGYAMYRWSKKKYQTITN
ncbi:MAG: APC family permease [bacterium]